jgi:hypothetical protein
MMCNHFSRLHVTIFCLLSVEEHPVFWSVCIHICLVATALLFHYRSLFACVIWECRKALYFLWLGILGHVLLLQAVGSFVRSSQD